MVNYLNWPFTVIYNWPLKIIKNVDHQWKRFLKYFFDKKLCPCTTLVVFSHKFVYQDNIKITNTTRYESFIFKSLKSLISVGSDKRISHSHYSHYPELQPSCAYHHCLWQFMGLFYSLLCAWSALPWYFFLSSFGWVTHHNRPLCHNL